ncbi:uncharacterized protein ATC70_008464 [Mucor velutinosus]|uniref:Uncharacterized protein n=1 Tax=Mucor velutinosus TaxID=708070 RepID=A0AAN7DQI4_9FUNG|nr:hypothetical protein ATC70_008464 [Mucor velutinosus]
MSFADENNAYDCLLMNAFESYSQQSPSGIRAATSTVRHFVWNMTEYKLVSDVRQLVKSFPKGRQGNTLDLASMVLERLSSVFVSKVCTFPSFQCERKVSCSMEKAHAYAKDDFFSFIYMLPTNIINEMRDCHGFFNEAALDAKFNDLFREKVLEEHQKGRCNAPRCDGVSTSFRSLPQDNQFPKLMFVQDGANFVLGRTAGNNVYMPTYIHVSQTVKYKLHGRIYSTSFDGVHFYTRCYKTIGGIVYLVDIDNWQQQQMKVLTSDLDVAERLLKDISKTVYACYKRV